MCFSAAPCRTSPLPKLLCVPHAPQHLPKERAMGDLITVAHGVPSIDAVLPDDVWLFPELEEGGSDAADYATHWLKSHSSALKKIRERLLDCQSDPSGIKTDNLSIVWPILEASMDVSLRASSVAEVRHIAARLRADVGLALWDDVGAVLAHDNDKLHRYALSLVVELIE